MNDLLVADATALLDIPGAAHTVTWRAGCGGPSCLAAGWLDIEGLSSRQREDTFNRLSWALHRASEKLPTASTDFQGLNLFLRPDEIELAPQRQGHMAQLVALLKWQDSTPWPSTDEWVFAGELDAAGRFMPVRNPLALGLAAKRMDKWLGLPPESASIAASVWPKVLGIDTGADIIGNHFPQGAQPCWPETHELAQAVDMKYVRGQEVAKRSLEIAVAGGHDLLMIGPPG